MFFRASCVGLKVPSFLPFSATVSARLLCANNSKSHFVSYSSASSFSSFQYRNFGTGGEGLYRRLGGLGYPMMYIVTYDKPSWQPLWEEEYEVMPRDEFGVPASIPPEVSTTIKHVYYPPPQFYPFFKKLGDDTPELKSYMHKLIQGKLTFDDYEEMFYKFAKPLKIYRKQIAMPYRSPEEQLKTDEVNWESAWLSYRQRVLGDFNVHMYLREYILGCLIGIYFMWLWVDAHKQYRLDMKLFYLEAPEHKLNWVKPRGDL